MFVQGYQEISWLCRFKLELRIIPYLNNKKKKAEIGSYYCLENLGHHRIAYSGSFFLMDTYMKASDILICPWHDLPTNSHFHISEIKMLCSNVSAECAVSCIMCFEAVLHTTLLRAFREKRTNYRKESCLPFVWGGNNNHVVGCSEKLIISKESDFSITFVYLKYAVL